MKSTFGMSHQFLHFSNINSCNVGLNGNGSVISELLCSHKSIALACPPNIRALLSRKVANGQIKHELSSSMMDESIQCFPVGLLTKFLATGNTSPVLKQMLQTGMPHTDELVDFLARTLQESPGRRLSASQLLKHPFI